MVFGSLLGHVKIRSFGFNSWVFDHPFKILIFFKEPTLTRASFIQGLIPHFEIYINIKIKIFTLFHLELTNIVSVKNNCEV
jgi:hypothetical protein